jgi:hypothetical protein
MRFRACLVSQLVYIALVQPVVVAHACNPSYLGGWDWEDQDLKPAWAESSQDPHLQNNQSKMDFRTKSSGIVPTLQVESPEFKPHSH